MNNVNGIEPKYEDISKMSRARRDDLIFQQLEIMSNEVARISRTVAEIRAKI